MIENNASHVSAAFEILLEEIETEIDIINNLGTQGFEKGDYDSISNILERAKQTTAFRDKVATLRKEWQTLSMANNGSFSAAGEGKRLEEYINVERRNMGRLQRGLRTPELAYYRPILQALTELGGAAKLNDVLLRVAEIMKPILKSVDYEPLASDPGNPRWRNTAQWARNAMVQEDLLKQKSPRGIWEITEAGRDFFAKTGNK